MSIDDIELVHPDVADALLQRAKSELAPLRQRVEEAKTLFRSCRGDHAFWMNRTWRAESCLRRIQRLADDGVDDPAGPHNVLAHIANAVETVLSSPPADASTMGVERERRLASALRNLLALYEDDEGCRDIQEYKDGISALAEMEQKS